MPDDLLGFDLNYTGDSEISQPYRVRLWVCDLLVYLFRHKEIKFLQLLLRFILLHIKQY